MKTGDTTELVITSINSDGHGVARRGDFVIFVEGALPGERVAVRLREVKKTYARAVAVRLLGTSDVRVQPACPHANTCGGCTLQHMDYAHQLVSKEDIVRTALRRIGGFDVPIAPVVPSPHVYGYRNKAIVPVRQQRGQMCVGYYKKKSHQIVPMERCPVLHPAVERLLQDAIPKIKNTSIPAYDEDTGAGSLREIAVRYGENTGELYLCFVLRTQPSRKEAKDLCSVYDELAVSHTGLVGMTLHTAPMSGNFVWGGKSRVVRGRGHLREIVSGFKLSYEDSSFFQVNTQAAELLYAATARAADGAKSVLELYSGIGSLTLHLAQGAISVTAVEEWHPAARWIEKNAHANGLHGKITPLCAAAESIAPVGNFDCVVLDPPRTGCTPEVLEIIAKSGADKIVYVSCNPATLARDAKILSPHGYTPVGAQVFDLFPHTSHVETVMLMSRK